MIRPIALAAVLLAPALVPTSTALAGPVYVALGDSITFGETDLSYVQSYGDRGYVGDYADYLAGRNGGVRPTVINLAIDGETASSFMTGSGRVPPVTGRTDAVLADENLNYATSPPTTQEAKFLATVAGEKVAGNTISTVSITLGFNDLSNLVGMPASAVMAGLMDYQAKYSSILAEIRQMAPNANLIVLGYFNPFPADPTSPAASTFNTYGSQLNGIIQALAGQYGGSYVNTFTPFLGHESSYTYLGVMPHGNSPVGNLPIGNVHPNSMGYGVIAAQVESVPEPASLLLVATGCVPLLIARRGRPGRR